ncbi:carcinoembryonic antigen-related cell adhesion molecule 5-like [Engraulis encrasicolus]|uniref:carcinoembryonic antigen-related cell adhesion molecule 5-like n=1 Tax=Engraulis encrasicolus TaxID=184585 RepID=UPI002FD59EBB
MDSQIFFTVWMLTAVGLCLCENHQIIGPLNGAVGGSVEFRLINPPSVTPDAFTWSFGTIQICTAVGGPASISPTYRARASVDGTTATLVLRDLTLSDTGEYKIEIFTNGVENNAAATLTVFERISNVTLAANQTELVEFNRSVTLTCSASGSSPSFQWFNRSEEVTGSDGGTLTIESVTRYDTGPYKCNASNIVSFGMSSEVTMTIAYGPDNAVVRVTPEAEFYSSGSTIVLSCSSESSPAAQIQWALNGTLLGKEGPELRLENVQASQSGEYTCWAHNSETQRYKLSSPTSITVLERISGVTLAASPTELVEFNSSVTLTCSASGSSPSFQWFNRSDEVTGSDGGTLTIESVTRYDTGPYKCNASNIVSFGMSSEVTMTIAYGPDTADIRVTPAEEFYSSGSTIVLSCSSISSPAAQFQWALNGTLLGKEGPELRLENVQASQSGEYSCWVHNSKTLRYTLSSPTSITVYERVSDPAITISGSPGPLVAGKSSVSLTCEAKGNITTRKWMKNGGNLSPEPDRVTIGEDNRTVSISPVQKEDTGDYTCQVSNPISNVEASGILKVNYGPEAVFIKGEGNGGAIKFVHQINLICSVESVPDCTYTWTLNGTHEIGTGASYIKEKSVYEDSGIYICTASNSITTGTSKGGYELSVKVPGSCGHSGLSVGAIVGIVVAVIIAIAAAGIGMVFEKHIYTKR